MNTEIIWIHSHHPSAPSPEASDLRNGPRGFTWMDEVLEHEIDRSVGRAANLIGTVHEFRREEARIAGRKDSRAFRMDRRKGEKGRRSDVQVNARRAARIGRGGRR
jgi:hypothetical protein